MLFSDAVPDKVQETPEVSSFVAVLDELQDFKSEIIANALSVYNAGILMDNKWLIKRLFDFGVYLPINYPTIILQQYLLNVDTLCRTKGSKVGVELYCSLLSLGEVTIDDDDFYVSPQWLLMDSMTQGFITADNSYEKFHLCDDTQQLSLRNSLDINIKSRYFNGEYPQEAGVIKSYIEKTIVEQLVFVSDCEINFSYEENSDFYFHNLLNNYFV